jgi:hypothetical protein
MDLDPSCQRKLGNNLTLTLPNPNPDPNPNPNPISGTLTRIHSKTDKA